MSETTKKRGRPLKPGARRHTRSTTFDDREIEALVSRALAEGRPIADLLRDGALAGLTRGDSAPSVGRS